MRDTFTFWFYYDVGHISYTSDTVMCLYQRDTTRYWDSESGAGQIRQTLEDLAFVWLWSSRVYIDLHPLGTKRPDPRPTAETPNRPITLRFQLSSKTCHLWQVFLSPVSLPPCLPVSAAVEGLGTRLRKQMNSTRGYHQR